MKFEFGMVLFFNNPLQYLDIDSCTITLIKSDLLFLIIHSLILYQNKK